MNRGRTRHLVGVSICLVSLLYGLVLPGPAPAQKEWSFSAISDIHAMFRSYQNVLNEIKAPTVAQEDRVGIADFVLVLGDLSPVSVNHRIFRETFQKSAPAFFPARGNHETAQDLLFIEREILSEASGGRHGVTRLGRPGFSYWVDWKNIRLIVLDQYADFRKAGATLKSLQWLTAAIESTQAAEHIFLAFHEPYFPWETEEDPLWSILLKHRSRIRAILFGHTHFYYHARFPDSLEGIHTINVGNAGQSTHSDHRQTIVSVSINGRRAWVRTVQTPDGKTQFRVSDGFELGGN